MPGLKCTCQGLTEFQPIKLPGSTKHGVTHQGTKYSSSMPSAKWQSKMGNWHARKHLDGQTKRKIASQNILRLPKQILMAIQIFFAFHALHMVYKITYTYIQECNKIKQ